MRSFLSGCFLVLSIFLAGSALASQSTQTSQATTSALTNKDIIGMVKAGLTQEIVIAKINTSACDFDTSPSTLKELKATNIPDAIILAMVQARHEIPSQPTVDKILEKYIQARSGVANIASPTSRYEKGSIEFQNTGGPLVQGTIEFYAKVPNKRLSVIEVAGFGQVREGFDGTLGWEENPQTSVLEKSGQNLSVAKRGAEFYESIKLRELYPKMTFKGEQTVGQKTAYVIEANPGDGSIVRMYFDTDTGLLVRNELEYDTPLGHLALDWHFEDFREVDGVKVPFTMHGSSNVGSTTIRLTEVRNNLAIDDAIFAKPASVAVNPTPLAPVAVEPQPQPKENARKAVQGIANAMTAYGWTASPHWRPGECQSRQNGDTTQTVCAPNDPNLDACIYDWQTTQKFTCRTNDGKFVQY